MSIDRKAAIAAYKERKTAVGIYVVRCEATGEAWVGQALDLEKVPNRIWFTLQPHLVHAAPGRTSLPCSPDGVECAWRRRPDLRGVRAIG
jgi:hypothetical protein